jgi:hypothetical protein
MTRDSTRKKVDDDDPENPHVELLGEEWLEELYSSNVMAQFTFHVPRLLPSGFGDLLSPHRAPIFAQRRGTKSAIPIVGDAFTSCSTATWRICASFADTWGERASRGRWQACDPRGSCVR